MKTAYLLGDTYEIKEALARSKDWTFDQQAKAWKLKFDVEPHVTSDAIIDRWVSQYGYTSHGHFEVMFANEGETLIAPSPTQKLQQLHDALRNHPKWASEFKGKLDLAKSPMKERYAAHRTLYGYWFHSRPVVQGSTIHSDVAKTFEVEEATPPPETTVEETSTVAATPTPPADLKSILDALAVVLSRPAGVDRKAVGEMIAERMEHIEVLLPELIRKHAVVTHTVEVVQNDGLVSFEGETIHKQFPDLLKMVLALKAKGRLVNIWLAGPAGSGKTKAASMVAQALGLPFYMHGSMLMPHELLGFVMPTTGKYVSTPFRQAYEQGGVVLLDEIDAGDNAAVLPINAALANGEASFPDSLTPIKRHPDCIVIGAANTWGLGGTADYVGRARLDAAFLNRFAGKLSWQYDEDLETLICGNPAWAKRVQQARATAKTKGIKVIITPRESMAGADLIAGGFSEDEAAQVTYLAGLSDSDKAALGFYSVQG